MDVLVKQVRRAQRRLMLQQFLGLAVWCWFGALLIATLAIGVSKIWLLNIDGSMWAAGWIGGSLVAGTLVALVGTFWRRSSRLDSALEIDRRFGLKERVSSSLALRGEELESAAGRALVVDAIGRVSRINVTERFRLHLGRTALLPLGPAVLAFGLALLVNEPTRDNSAQATSTEPTAEHIKKSAESAEKKLAERRKQAEEEGLEDADLLKKLEQGLKELSKKNVGQKQALVQLNDLAKEAARRREQLAGDEKMKQQFNQLKDLDKGPADKLGQAMKNGDFGKAVQELNKLKNQLAKGDLNDKEKADLAKQLQQMQQRLDKMADAHRQAQQQLQQQIDRAKQAGQNGEAEKLQQQLDKLDQQNAQMDKLAQMASKLGQCGKCMKNGNAKGAQAALDQLADSMKQMQQQESDLEMLDDALAQIDQCKNAMACKECNGAGCKACQRQGQGDQGKPDGPPGNGLAGGGRGYGPRPEKKTDNTRTYESNVRQNVGSGGAEVVGFVDGPSRKGDVQEQIKEQFESARRVEADPLSGQRLPHDYREHAKKYFDSFRESQK